MVKSKLAFDVMLGGDKDSPQYGVLGETKLHTVAFDLNQTHTISLFGVQGGGKSYTLGSIAEMALFPIPGVNELPKPLATVIFHYSATMEVAPEFVTMGKPNDNASQVKLLKSTYGAEPDSVKDVLILTSADKVEERKKEFPDIEVMPLKFSSAELKANHWRFLMGAVGNKSFYMKQFNRVLKSIRNELTLEKIREQIDESKIGDNLKELAHSRLDLAADYIDDKKHVSKLLKPGRLVIVDLRDEFIERDEALGIFVVLLQLFADAIYQDSKGRQCSFNKLVVFDEAHKYIDSEELLSGLVEVVREMRHKGTSVMIASQDPPSVPIELIELSSQIILHKFNSPSWLKHIQKANVALGNLESEDLASLKPGEAYVWSSTATHDAFVEGAQKVWCRQRVTKHGGSTKVAVR